LVESGEFADNARITGGAGQRFIGQIGQFAEMEAGSECLETPRGHFPVAVTPRPPKQIQMMREALGEGLPQFREQSRIVTRSSGQVGVELSSEIGHHSRIVDECLSRGLTRGAL